MLTRQFLPRAVVVSVLLVGACGLPREFAKYESHKLIHDGVEDLKPRVVAATDAARARLHIATAGAVHVIAGAATRGFDQTMTKLESSLDETTATLTSAACSDMDAIVDDISSRASAVWNKSIDDLVDRLVEDVKRTARARREDELAAIEVELIAQHDLALSNARAQASTAAKDEFQAALADVEGEKRACMEQPDADEATCEGRYRDAVATAKQNAHASREAKVQAAIDDLDAKRRTDSARLAAESEARIDAWLEAERAKFNERTAALRAQARARAEQMVSEVHTVMKTAREGLATDIHDKLRTVAVAKFAPMTEADIERLVNSSLDGFLEHLQNQLLTSLESEATKRVDELIDNATATK